MAQFKKDFHLGKMNKDMDERVVPSGEYRDALNLQVQSSDGSNMGAAQTLMGNVLISKDLVPVGSTCVGSIASNKNDKVYYLVAGPEFLPQDWDTAGAWKDYIIEYDIKTEKFKYVFVDIYKTNFQVASALDHIVGSDKNVSNNITLESSVGNPFTHIRRDMFVEGFGEDGLNYISQHVKGDVTVLPGVTDDNVRLFSTYTDFSSTTIIPGSWLNFSSNRILNFHKNRYITGINIIDGMLFWTDNNSEPKKINIDRCVAGTGGYEGIPTTMPGIFDGDTALFHTRLCVTPDKSNPLTVKLRTIKTPWFVEEENITVIRKAPLSAPILKMSKHEEDRVDEDLNPVATFSSTNGSPTHISGPPIPTNNSFSYKAANGFTYTKKVGDLLQNVRVDEPVFWKIGDTILFNQNQDDDVSVEGFTEHDVRATVDGGTGAGVAGSDGPFNFVIESIDTETIDTEQKTWHLRLEEKKPMFEFKIPRFAYRYKYEDGEYSTFSPWSLPAFLPGTFDYLPKKAYNLGMTNRLRSLKITNYVVEESLRPQDVVEIDLLYKEESSPNVYTVETIKMTDGWNQDDLLLWPDSVTGPYDNVTGLPLVNPNNHHRGEYRVTSELIHATVPSNQLLRQWDNVPRVALAQEITSNRLVYGNYLQNYNLTSIYSDLEIKPKLVVSLSPSQAALGATEFVEDPNDESEEVVIIRLNEDDEFETLGAPMPHKTCRSLREYQVGVVYGDEYGRETPVLAGDGSTGTLNIPKEHSSTINKLEVQLASNAPDWAKYFKFFVKETSNEYYNMAMDRWYNAEDGNIWLSFASADRNKIDDETFIVLKKRHDTHQPVDDPARYKVIAIENSAPDFIKTNVKDLGAVYNAPPNNDSIGTTTLGFPLVDYSELWLDDGALGIPDVLGQSNAVSTFDEGNIHVGSIYDKISAGTFFLRIRTSNIKSDWYQVTKMIKESDRYKFKIDGVFNDDVGFATTNGTYSGRISGLRIQFANHQVENKKEFEGRFFVKIYKDLVLLQNLLIPTEVKYKVTNVSRMGYWNMPQGDRASRAATNPDAVNWDSYSVNCKAELNADNGILGVTQVRNPGFAINGVPNTASDRTFFFYTANNGRQFGRPHNTGICEAKKGTKKWMEQSTGYFFVDATWARATKDYTFGTGCSRTNFSKIRGRGVFNNGLSMDIGYIHVGEYDWPDDGLQEDFKKQITTKGTTFRFREDKDGIVYRITGSCVGSSTNNKTCGKMHTYANPTAGEPGNNYTRFTINFEHLDDPGAGLGTGPSGYNIVGGKNSTGVSGIQELGWWGGIHTTGGLGGGGDDNDMVVPMPPGYGVSSASCGSGTTYTDGDGNTVTAIKQAIRWRQHTNKYHHIEIIEVMDDDDSDFTSKNPAIWETEPKEDVGMDIYYEASSAIPIDIKAATNELFAPIESIVDRNYSPHFTPTNGIKVKSWSENSVTLYNPDDPNFVGVSIKSGDRLRFTRPDGAIYTAIVNGAPGVPWNVYALGQNPLVIRGWRGPALPIANLHNNSNPHNQKYTLNWFNAYAFGNGVESNRIRDDYNQTVIRNGVKASTVLAEQYKEDRRKTGLIHSGIYNSTSGINRLNQFIQAEKITKDMNPQYGSIQKLHTRDSNIVVLHEDKCMKVLADKDALFNADGGKNVAISSNFLGSDEPFATRYGISTNPESCATDLAGRLYFADRTRGAVLRLSNDGITNISNYGMKDWFGDNLGPLTRQILGSFDEKKEEYNITIKGLYPVGESEDNKCGCVNANDNVQLTADTRDTRSFDNTTIVRNPSNINIGDVSVGDRDFYNSEVTLSFSEKAKGWISFKSFVPESGVSINNEYYTFKDGEMYKHHANPTRNTFYKSLLGDDAFTESSVTLLFNDQPSTVKSFSTLNYEGSQARNKKNGTDGEYSNLVERNGWYVSYIKTNLQESNYLEFKNKEGKWFTHIKGDTTTLQNLDEREFSVQGIGSYETMHVEGDAINAVVPIRCLTITPEINCKPVLGCMDRDAENYNPNANTDDGSCVYKPDLDDSDDPDDPGGGGPLGCPDWDIAGCVDYPPGLGMGASRERCALGFSMNTSEIPANYDVRYASPISGRYKAIFTGNVGTQMGISAPSNKRIRKLNCWKIFSNEFVPLANTLYWTRMNLYLGNTAGDTTIGPAIYTWERVIITLNDLGIFSQTLTINDTAADVAQIADNEDWGLWSAGQMQVLEFETETDDACFYNPSGSNMNWLVSC